MDNTYNTWVAVAAAVKTQAGTTLVTCPDAISAQWIADRLNLAADLQLTLGQVSTGSMPIGAAVTKAKA